MCGQGTALKESEKGVNTLVSQWRAPGERGTVTGLVIL